jgi:hypothetical protein
MCLQIWLSTIVLPGSLLSPHGLWFWSFAYWSVEERLFKHLSFLIKFFETGSNQNCVRYLPLTSCFFFFEAGSYYVAHASLASWVLRFTTPSQLTHSFFFFFWWYWGLNSAYTLSHSTSPLLWWAFFFFFEIGLTNYLPRLASNLLILLISAFKVAGIKGVNHWCLAQLAES